MAPPVLVVATNNAGKLREFRRLLDGCGFDLVTPAELGVPFDVEETGTTFEENATLKAVAAARLTGCVALADDSGLEVHYLGGRPGIFSARYAGGDRTDPALSDEDRVEVLLSEMDGVPDDRRGARFRCVIAIADAESDEVRTVDGAWEGSVGHAPRGERGFGYDPVFVVPGRGVTGAELDPDEKDRLSHRGQAARKARELLRHMAARRAR